MSQKKEALEASFFMHETAEPLYDVWETFPALTPQRRGSGLAAPDAGAERWL